jgi:hypothetical protein
MLNAVWQATLRRAKVPCFRIYDFRSTYATQGVQEVLTDKAAEAEPAGE